MTIRCNSTVQMQYPYHNREKPFTFKLKHCRSERKPYGWNRKMNNKRTGCFLSSHHPHDRHRKHPVQRRRSAVLDRYRYEEHGTVHLPAPSSIGSPAMRNTFWTLAFLSSLFVPQTPVPVSRALTFWSAGASRNDIKDQLQGSSSLLYNRIYHCLSNMSSIFYVNIYTAMIY